jgi:hypothetical protein
VHVLSSAPLADSAWSFGGSILTFAFPMILFIAVAATLWVLYTKPELVPGRPAGSAERPVSYTRVPGQPAAEVAGAQDPAAAQGAQAAAAQPNQAPAQGAQAAAVQPGQAPAQGAQAAAVQPGQAPAEQGEASMQDGEAARTEDGE